jgi:predicted amidohydrolase
LGDNLDAVSRLEVAIVELPARFGKPELALAETASLLEREPKPDLALLPEAALTGYLSMEGRDPEKAISRSPWLRYLPKEIWPYAHTDLRPFAEPISGPTFEAVRSIARTSSVAIAAPLIERDGSRVYNSFFVVAADGTLLAHYRKRHPWYPETWAAPGELPLPHFTVGGATCTMAICFDVHFLEREESNALASSDVLLFPSAWVEDEEDDARGRILSRIARRFGTTIVNANWGPGTPRIRGQGSSRIVGEDGERARIDSRPGVAARLDAQVKPRQTRA